MKYRELVKRLRELGCEYLQDASGSHEIWMNMETRDPATSPRHEGKANPTGTFHSILRDLGVSYQDFHTRRKKKQQ